VDEQVLEVKRLNKSKAFPKVDFLDQEAHHFSSNNHQKSDTFIM